MTDIDRPLSRIEWYRELRTGWEPMLARFAWLQALANDGKSINDLYVALDSKRAGLARMTIANYKRGAEFALDRANPIAELFRKRRTPGQAWGVRGS